MKTLLAALLILFCLPLNAASTFRDPLDPVTPWPLEVGRQVIDSQTLLGIWTSPTASEADEWILLITPSDMGKSYQWEIFRRSTPSVRNQGVVYIRDGYVIGMLQSPFVDPEFLIMYLAKGELHMQIGDVRAPRVEGIFKRNSVEF